MEDVENVVSLRCGTLTLRVEPSQVPLEELCTFGSRRNRKRGFLVISKVLGKHVPVRPARMAQIHELLARQLIELPGPVVVIALAETAIGLGQGTFETLLGLTGRKDALFLHSTRYHLNRPLACTFRETHSHATEHLLYVPADPVDERLFREARTLVLVDDEISTGRTLTHLAQEVLNVMPQVEAVRFASITDWLDPARHAEIGATLDRDVRFHSILRGQLRFDADASFDPGPLPDVVGGGLKDSFLRRNHGRLGTRESVELPWNELLTAADLRGGERVLVLGTGEFVHAPYLFARRLEERGWDVHFQSTTRSPVLVGEGIVSAVEFVDNYHDEIPNYVYNVADRNYDRILVCYETLPLPTSHHLEQLLGARPLFF